MAGWSFKRWFLCFVVLCSSFTSAQIALPLAVGGTIQKLAADLQGLTGGTGSIIVQYSQPPTATDLLLAALQGAVVQQQLPAINSVVYSLPLANVLSLLNADSSISYITPDRSLSGSLDYAATTVGADTAWAKGYDGRGVTVAVIDSGITTVPDLRTQLGLTSRVLANQSFVNGSTSTGDAYGHGDHVAGIIAGDAASSTCLGCFKSIRGIAPNASLVNLRVLDRNGSGTDSAVIAAIQQAINLKQAYNIRVINLSLGRPVFESYRQDPLCQAVEAAWRAGIVVVVAAGNYGRDNSHGNQGYGTITSPGNDPYVITVGAMKTMATTDRSDDLIATYSSKGPTLLDHVVKPDIVAPGNLIVSLLSSTSSTLYQTYPQNVVPPSYYSNGLNLGGASYFRLSGTSMAAPMVSGAAAVLLQQRPGLTPDQVKALLMKSSYKTFPVSSTYIDPATGITYTDQYDIFTIGAGYLDIAAALEAANPPSSASAISPTVRYDPSTGMVYMVDGSSVLWGSSSDWGDAAVWGSAVFSGNLIDGSSVLWGSSVCWGTTTDQGFSVLWGSSVVWGSQSPSDAMSIFVQGE